MYLRGDDGGIVERDLNPRNTLLFPGLTGQSKVNMQLFTTVWVPVGPAGGTAIKLPYMARFPVGIVALP